MERKFGFFAGTLDFKCGDIKISTLPETEEIKKTINKRHSVYKDIIYGPRLQLISRKVNIKNNTEEKKYPSTAIQFVYFFTSKHSYYRKQKNKR